jgi:uncharacterized protein involved in outer membrane biogenesis
MSFFTEPMAIRRKWLRLAMAALALVVAAQVAVGVLVRTGRVHEYLIAQLGRAFGRQVDVRRFDAQVFPSLRLDANGVTVGEDPAFGNEYFLRAEKLSAGLRWKGLLRGHFEFGTIALTRPSLILVRSGQGRWNLEDWLPPAKSNGSAAMRIYGPPTATSAANRLQKIEFEDGRVNFKLGQDKKPFAFIGVTGSVEQISAGRWQLQLEAQPWRSGVALQSAGVLYVRGDVAGTSARLQPAQFAVHWTRVSLADLLRLVRGQDYGVRGSFALDAMAQSAAPADGPTSNSTNSNGASSLSNPSLNNASPADWTFSIQARATSIHRWDLTERADNPRVNVKLGGRGSVAARSLNATEMVLEAPGSNLRGAVHFAEGVPEVQVDSAGIQTRDLLAWWRAFEPGVDEGLSVEQYLTGSTTVRGWPPRIERLAFSSDGGVAKISGIAEPVWIGTVRGGREREKLVMEPVRLQLGGDRAAVTLVARRRASVPLHNAGDLTASQDFAAHEGGLEIEAQVDQIATVLRAAAAIGRPINHGWDLDGRALGAMQWDWYKKRGERWSGKIVVSKAHLAVAGLNQQLQVGNAACVIDHGRHSVLLGAVEGFGTTWSGTIRENRDVSGETQPRWNFSLHGALLDAADIDRWVGPRARPGWLQTLLSSLGGSSGDAAKADSSAETSSASIAMSGGVSASELLRRVDAEGDLSLDGLSLEKLNFEKVHVTGRLRGLQLEASEIDAQWAGGKVRGSLSAKFFPRPAYDLSAQLDSADLAQLPAMPNVSERWSGLASGRVHLTTEGVGRVEVLQNLIGQGIVALRNVEFRGWDVGASVADGAAHEGVSHWSSGTGSFSVRNRKLLLDNLRLDADKQTIFVNGSVDFAREAELLINSVDGEKRSARPAIFGRTLRVKGPLDAPQVSEDTVPSRNSAVVAAP